MISFSLLACLLAGFPLHAGQSAWQELHGQDSAIRDQRTLTVRTPKKWAELWAEHAGDDKARAPYVDFADSEFVVAVFLGEKTRGGTRVELKPVVDPLDSSRLDVFYREIPPEAASTQKACRPFAILKVSQPYKMVAFEADLEVVAAPAAELARKPLKLRLDPELLEKMEAARQAPERVFDKAAPETAAPAEADAVPALTQGKKGELYFSWGYNTEAYLPEDIHFSQPGLGNDFTLHGVKAHDQRDWKVISQITVPQYSIRVGYFLPDSNWGLELNYDHAKYVVSEDQSVRMTGLVGGQKIDKIMEMRDVLADYRYNNGANWYLLNVVRRLPIIGEPGQTMSLTGLAKAGVGIMIPHTQNTVFGHENNPGFQFGGFDMGVEGGLRFMPLRPLYIEWTAKALVAKYNAVHIYQGQSDQTVHGLETILSLGTSFDLGSYHRP